MVQGLHTESSKAYQEQGQEVVNRSGSGKHAASYVCYDFSSILRPRRLHFRGLGHPSVAFWTLWVTRLIPGSHFVNLFVDFGSLWAPKWVARAAEETPKSLKRVLLGHPFKHFSTKR